MHSCKTIGVVSIILMTIFIFALTCYAGESPPNIRLNCQRYALTLRLDHPVALPLSPVLPLNNALATSKDSSSWVPRIVIPIVAIAVIGTTTYLIFSQRG
jgi:hypothetical protein